jgi:hypothetical protein
MDTYHDCKEEVASLGIDDPLCEKSFQLQSPQIEPSNFFLRKLGRKIGELSKDFGRLTSVSFSVVVIAS